MTTAPKIVCFDWGGVILRICRSFAEGCERAGLEVRDISEPELKARRLELKRLYQTGRISPAEYFKGTSEAMAGRYTPDEVERLDYHWLIGEYDGARELVEDLNALVGVSTALLSNTSEAHFARGTGLEPDFPTISRLEHIHASHLLGACKPDETIYTAFERELDIAPNEVLFFDDLPENVAAAKARGWRSEQIDHEGDTAAQMRGHLRAHGIDIAQSA